MINALRTRWWIWAALPLQIAWAGGALSVEQDGVPGPEALQRLGGEFRVDLLYDDHGQDPGTKPKAAATQALALSVVNLKYQQILEPATTLQLRANLLANKSGQYLDYAYLTHWFNSLLGVVVGKQRVLQGGWDHMDSGFQTHFAAPYTGNLVYPDFDNSIALHAKVSGDLILQLLNDVVVDGGTPLARPGEWSHTQHPTWVLGWIGQFGPITPLLDFGSYDVNRSRWFDMSLKAAFAGLSWTLGYYSNVIVHQDVSVSDGNVVSDKDVAVAVNVYASYQLRRYLVPWGYFSHFNVQQGTALDVVAPRQDLHYNVPLGPDDKATGRSLWNDNATTWGLGVDIATEKGLHPFFAAFRTSGVFLPGDNVAAQDTEKRSNTVVKVGLFGAF